MTKKKNTELKVEEESIEVKVGELYFVPLKKVYSASLYLRAGEEKYDLDSFQHKFIKISIDRISYNDSLLLLKYLGDGKFAEYYTRTIIKFYETSIDDEIFENYYDFMNEFNEKLRHPLFVEKCDLLLPTNENRVEFYEQEGIRREEVESELQSQKNEAISMLRSKLSLLASEDAKFAYCEEKFRNFEAVEPHM